MTNPQPESEEDTTMTEERILKTADLLGDVSRFLRNRVGDTAAISLAITCEHDQRELVRLVDAERRARWTARHAS